MAQGPTKKDKDTKNKKDKANATAAASKKERLPAFDGAAEFVGGVPVRTGDGGVELIGSAAAVGGGC